MEKRMNTRTPFGAPLQMDKIHVFFTLIVLSAKRFQQGEQRICNPGVASSILGRDVISPCHLISETESNGHLSLTADSRIRWN